MYCEKYWMYRKYLSYVINNYIHIIIFYKYLIFNVFHVAFIFYLKLIDIKFSNKTIIKRIKNSFIN